MPDPLVIELGGRQVELRLDFNALSRWESVTGRSALTAGTWDQLSASDLRALIWAMGAADVKAPTLEEVGAALTPDRLEELLHLVDEVLGVSLPRTAGDADDDVAGLQQRWLDLHAFALVELGRTPAELGGWTPALLEAVNRQWAAREERADRRAALVAAAVATAVSGHAVTPDQLLQGHAGGNEVDIIQAMRDRGLVSG